MRHTSFMLYCVLYSRYSVLHMIYYIVYRDQWPVPGGGAGPASEPRWTNGRVRKFLLRGGYFVRAILPHPLLRVAGDFLPRPLLRCREGVAEAGRARHFFDNAPATPVAEGVAESSARWAANKEILNDNFCTGPYYTISYYITV